MTIRRAVRFILFVLLSFTIIPGLLTATSEETLAGPSYLPGGFHLMASPAIVQGQTYNVTFTGPEGYSTTIPVKALSPGIVSVPVPPYVGGNGDFVMGADLTATMEGITSGEITVSELPVLPDGDYAGFLIAAWNNSITLLQQSLADLETLGSSSHLDAIKALFNAQISELTGYVNSMRSTGSVTFSRGGHQMTYTAADLKDAARLLFSEFLGLYNAIPGGVSGQAQAPRAETWNEWWHQINDRVTNWNNGTEQLKKLIFSNKDVIKNTFKSGDVGLDIAIPLVEKINMLFQISLNITWADACSQATRDDLDGMKDIMLDVEAILAVVNGAWTEAEGNVRDIFLVGDWLADQMGNWLADMTRIKDEFLAWYEAGSDGGGGGGTDVDLSGTWWFEYQYSWTGTTGTKTYYFDCNVKFGDDGMARGVCLIGPYTLSGNSITIFQDLGNGFTYTFTGTVSGNGMSGTFVKTNCDGCHDFIWSANRTD